MEENLVGYLLNALEPHEQRDVEDYLRENPESRDRLELLRQALEPMAVDRDAIEPPADLWVRTLAAVAEYQCRKLPPAPDILSFRPSATPRSWWRRADVAVAAGILLCLALLVPSGINYVRYRHDLVSCQNNLRGFYGPLKEYSESHAGNFPDVAMANPRDVAGMFIPILNHERPLPDHLSVTCPSMGHVPPEERSLDELLGMDAQEFARCAPQLAGCYAYTLGYRDQGGHHGLRIDSGKGSLQFLPILSDCSPAQVADGDPGNSPNHGGKGQNLLYLDGHCSFSTSRNVGCNGDDIFTNFDHKVAEGKALTDTVLGNSASRP